MSASLPNDNSPAAPAPVGPASAAAPAVGKSSYGQILKSSALIGGSSVLNIGIGIVRTKVMAILLGPAGFGLMSLYGSILDLALSIAAMGINSSGVRQIAEAASSGDTQRIARTAVVLRRTALVLGLVGAVALAAFSPQISTVTFGSDRHAGAVALLALALFFRVVADSQGALIQGMRRIADLARMGVLGALLGAVVSIALVYALGEEGVAPSLVGGAAMALVIAWWFSRKVSIERPDLTRAEVTHEAGALLKLGVAFMGSGFLMMGAAYVVRMIVVRDVGLEAAGFYHAAWTLGGLYVGIILQAMGADFYPRLVGVANNDAECNRVVNEQAHVSLLLAGPGVLATLTFAPLVISLVLQRQVRGGGRGAALDMPRNRPAGDYLADGLHHRGEEQASPFSRCRPRMDRRERGAHLDMRESVWAERGRHRVLRLLRVSRADDLPARPKAKRISVVDREQENGPAVRFLDRSRLLRILRNAIPPSVGNRDIADGYKRHLFDPSAHSLDSSGPRSAFHTAASSPLPLRTRGLIGRIEKRQTCLTFRPH